MDKAPAWCLGGHGFLVGDFVPRSCHVDHLHKMFHALKLLPGLCKSLRRTKDHFDA